MNRYPSPLIGLAILLYATWNATELFHGWVDPYTEKDSWLIFLVWSAPLPLYWLTPKSRSGSGQPFNPILLWSALVITFLGVIGSINAVQYLGFATALSAFLPLSWPLLPWLFSALSWMPAFGWLGLHYFPDPLLGMRFIVAIGGTAFWIVTTYHPKKGR